MGVWRHLHPSGRKTDGSSEPDVIRQMTSGQMGYHPHGPHPCGLKKWGHGGSRSTQVDTSSGMSCSHRGVWLLSYSPVYPKEFCPLVVLTVGTTNLVLQCLSDLLCVLLPLENLSWAKLRDYTISRVNPNPR